jgi:hypothetical protein
VSGAGTEVSDGVADAGVAVPAVGPWITAGAPPAESVVVDDDDAPPAVPDDDDSGVVAVTV